MSDRYGISAKNSAELKTFEKLGDQGDLVTVEGLKQLFKNNADVEFQPYFFSGYQVHLIICNGMVNQQLLYSFVMEKLTAFCENVHPHWEKQDGLNKLQLPGIKEITDKGQLINAIFQGSAAIFFEEKGFLFSTDVAE